jgi:putative nucleotidyltransferase-like protein
MVNSLPAAPLSDTGAFQREWPVLLECTSPTPDAQRLAGLVQSVDWPRLLALAEEHGVTGHLARSLRDVDGNVVPAETRQALIERRRAQTFFSLKMSAALFRLLERFTSEGIGVLVVKGPVLSVQAYGEPAMRSYGDLDLLVRQRDIRRATELMIHAGYEPKVPVSAIDAGKIPGQYLFCRQNSKELVELHNDYTLRYFPRRLSLEGWFERQIRVRLDGQEAPALSVEDELVLICVHGAKHFWERLMWIADVAALVSRQTGMDWKRVAVSTGEVGAERILHLGLRLAADLFRVHLPNQVSAEVRSDVVATRLAAHVHKWLPAAGYASPGLFERLLFRLRMGGGLLTGPAYLMRLSFTPTEEDWKVASPGTGRWFPDAVRRPFRLARKYGRGSKE